MTSSYLEDMKLSPGDLVICKAAVACPTFTPRKIYTVCEGGKLEDDTGFLAIPSARFILLSSAQPLGLPPAVFLPSHVMHKCVTG